MMLVPVIWLKSGNCQKVADQKDLCNKALFKDPVELAQLWRIQNAKTIQIELSKEACDLDLETVRNICDTLDIPVMVALAKNLENLVPDLLERGVMRVVINKGLGGEQSSDNICELANLRCLTLRYKESMSSVLSNKEQILKDLLFTKSSRFMLQTEFEENCSSSEDLLSAIRSLMAFLKENGCRARMSLQVPIKNHVDLLAYSKLETSGVDSLILPKSIYENIFPCQALWCWNEEGKMDLSKYSTAKLRRSN